ncbi:hypothetical protein Droror1_Dr00001127 [Drosera rotundifolia]
MIDDSKKNRLLCAHLIIFVTLPRAFSCEKMERNLSSLTFSGSIPEAITEARRQKKLFVVYISGKNPESAELEHSTWTDLNVGVCIVKYCILLHILEGSTDDANFSAIYPHTSAPCIAVIGYNGVRLWQHEGSVSAEVVVSHIQKSWLSLQIQETAASVFTATLSSESAGASDNPGPSDLPTSNLLEDSSSSNAVGPYDTNSTSSYTELVTPSQTQEKDIGHEHAEQATIAAPSGCGYTANVNQDESKAIPGRHADPVSETGGAKNTPLPVTSDGDATCASIDRTVESPAQSLETRADYPETSSEGTSRLESQDARVGTQDEISMGMEQKDYNLHLKDASPSDICLNIRLPNGANLQATFSKTSSLGLVKDFVDRNRTDGASTYELAIPYPRKAFQKTDLERSLVELGLTDRQALIVVPLRQPVNQTDRSFRNPTSAASDPPTQGGEGYLSFVKRILSYVNPFSYLGSTRASTSGNDSGTRTLGSSPSATSQNIPRRLNTENSQNSSSSAMRSTALARQKPATGFGSNIHTLKHDEDDAPFGDGNAFWNGNSTQFGGNDDSK